MLEFLRMKKTRYLVLVVSILGALALFQGCSSTTPNADPTGKLFPAVEGTSLEGRSHRVPDDFRGRKLLLLVGYVQDAQFDIDRWLLGLMQAQVPVDVRELPTIEGMVPRMIGNQIDSGMRRGIPEEDWGAVITVYGDASEIVDLTGNENPRNARVLLLDEEGRIIWFHDRGYSPRLIMEIQKLCTSSQ